MQTPLNSQLRSPKISALEGLRAWLAWWVVLGHMLQESGLRDSWLPSPGKFLIVPGLSVSIFIILSGFVITLLLDGQRCSYRTFIIGRFFRIFPLYYFILAVGAVTLPWLIDYYPLYLARVGDPTNGLHALYETWKGHAALFWQHIGACMLGLHGAMGRDFLPNAQSAFVSQAWSISLEWQFYLFAPLALAMLSRLRWAIALCFLLFVTVGLRGHFSLGGWNSFLPDQIELFALGAVSFYAYKHLRLEGDPAVYARGLAGVLIIAALLSTAFTTVVFQPWPFVNFMDRWVSISIWLSVLAIIIAIKNAPEDRLVRWVALPLTNRVALFLGRISYGTYIGHFIIIYLIQYGFLKFAPQHLNKWTILAALLCIGAPLIIVFSTVLHHFIELPGIRLGKKISSYFDKSRP